jgi:hypothetical protein
VTYTYVVTNTGDTTLLNVSVDDDKLGHVGDIPSLAPGQSVTLTKDAVLGEAGQLTNIGTAVGTDQLGAQVQDTDDETVSVIETLGRVRALADTGVSLGVLGMTGLAFFASGLALLMMTERRRSVSPYPGMSASRMASATDHRWIHRRGGGRCH